MKQIIEGYVHAVKYDDDSGVFCHFTSVNMDGDYDNSVWKLLEEVAIEFEAPDDIEAEMLERGKANLARIEAAKSMSTNKRLITDSENVA